MHFSPEPLNIVRIIQTLAFRTDSDDFPSVLLAWEQNKHVCKTAFCAGILGAIEQTSLFSRLYNLDTQRMMAQPSSNLNAPHARPLIS